MSKAANNFKKAVNVIVTLCIIAAIVLVAMILWWRFKPEEGFEPPPFEEAAQSGTPIVEDPTWSKMYQDGMDFSAHMTGILTVKDGASDVYFTNDEGNKVWLKLRVLDENDNILGETGLLKPNEYVKTVKLDIVPKPGDIVRLKIMAYEPDTYFSAGVVLVNTTAE